MEMTNQLKSLEKVCFICDEAFESYEYIYLRFEQKYGRSPDEAGYVEVCDDCYDDNINEKAKRLMING